MRGGFYFAGGTQVGVLTGVDEIFVVGVTTFMRAIVIDLGEVSAAKISSEGFRFTRFAAAQVRSVLLSITEIGVLP